MNSKMVVRWAKETSLLGWVLIHQVLEVERTSAKNHLVSLGVLGCWPFVAMVTSQKLLSSLRCLKEATMSVWKSFQRRQNCVGTLQFRIDDIWNIL